MKSRRHLILFLSCSFLLLSCLQEETTVRERQKGWFHYTDQRIKPIVATMHAIEFKQPFMEEFSKRHGVPLWDCTDIYQEADGEPVYFWVPLYREENPDEIQAIWFFEMKDNRLNYGPVSRDAEFIRQYGQGSQFDYLSYRAFGKHNASRMMFQEKATTRMYETVGVICRDAYVITEYKGVEYVTYKGTTCKEIKEWVDYVGIPNEDGGSAGGGGGGGHGTNVPVDDSSASVAPKADSIFKHATMTSTNWKTLEKMITKIINDCMGGKLYSKLKASLKGSKINIKFKNDGSSFNYSTNELSLSLDRIESNVLLHEIFHALQYYTRSEEEFKKSYLNLEIEAHYAQYSYLKKLPEYEGSKWEREITNSKRGIGIKGLDDYLGKYTLEEDYVLDTYLKYTLKPIFKSVEGYNNYTFDESKEGIENLSLFKELSKDCN